MLNFRRGLGAAAFLAIALGAAAASAQETNTIGPAELRDFRLPGARTTPDQPAPETPAERPAATPPRPAATTPAPAATPPAAERRAEPRTAPAQPAATAPRPAERSAVPAAAAPAAGATPAPAAPVAAADTPPPSEILPVPLQPQGSSAPALPTTVGPQQPGDGGTGFSWLWLAVPLILGLVALLAIGRRRRALAIGAEDYPAEAEAQPEAPAQPAQPVQRSLGDLPAPPAPRPVAKPALKLPPKVKVTDTPPPPPVAEPQGPRAIVEVEFIPARASATTDAAIVEFELVLKNVGDAPAGNIRIDTRMFNASATKEMAEFLKGPIHDRSGSPHVQIAPGDELRLQSAMAMPNADVREILMQGQRLFVPAVASIVAWDWGTDGRGRAALSWLVGRETENPAAKMGAFRLDQGPRVYRQVGVRPLKLVA